MKTKKLTNLIISMLALFGIAYAGAEEVAPRLFDGKAFKNLKYGERMYNADEIDQIIANISYFDPDAENIRLGKNSYGDHVVLFAAGTDERPASLVHGDPQCGNVTIGSAATNLNVCSVVIGKEAVGKNFGGVTLGFKANNFDSHSTAVGAYAKIISTVTPTMFCAYSDGDNYVPPDFFRPNTGFMNTAVNGYILDSYAGTSIGNEFGWTANELHGLDVTGQSVVIGKLAYVGSGVDKTKTNIVHCVTDSVAIGTAARVFADNGTAVGRQATVKGAGAVAIGFGAQALADDTIVIGRGTATVPGQVVIGGHLMATMQDVDEVVAQLRAENEALRAQLANIQTAATMMLNSLNAESEEPTTFAAGAAPAEKKEFTLEDFLQAIIK